MAGAGGVLGREKRGWPVKGTQPLPKAPPDGYKGNPRFNPQVTVDTYKSTR